MTNVLATMAQKAANAAPSTPPPAPPAPKSSSPAGSGDATSSLRSGAPDATAQPKLSDYVNYSALNALRQEAKAIGFDIAIVEKNGQTKFEVNIPYEYKGEFFKKGSNGEIASNNTFYKPNASIFAEVQKHHQMLRLKLQPIRDEANAAHAQAVQDAVNAAEGKTAGPTPENGTSTTGGTSSPTSAANSTPSTGVKSPSTETKKTDEKTADEEEGYSFLSPFYCVGRTVWNILSYIGTGFLELFHLCTCYCFRSEATADEASNGDQPAANETATPASSGGSPSSSANGESPSNS